MESRITLLVMVLFGTVAHAQWSSPTVTQAEYFFGVFDPGEGNGTPFLAEDGAFDSGVESLLRTSLDWTISAGPILFNVRVKGVDGQWGSLFKKPVWPQGPNPNPSLIPSGPLVICPGETVTIPYEGPNGGNITWFDRGLKTKGDHVLHQMETVPHSSNSPKRGQSTASTSVRHAANTSRMRARWSSASLTARSSALRASIALVPGAAKPPSA